MQFSLQPSLATGNISISETGIISLTQQNSDFLPVELGPTFTVSEGLSVVLRAERSGPYVHYSVAWGEPLGTPRYVDAKTLSEADDTSLTVEVGLWTSDVPPECTAWYDNVWLDHH